MAEEKSETTAYVGQVLQRTRQTRSRGGWPICLYLADPPGKTVLQAYTHAQAEAQRILYVEIPPPAAQKRSETYLPALFLKALGSEHAEQRDDAESKTMLLELLMVQREVDLMVLVDFHHLTTPAKRQPLAYETTWLKAFIKDLYPPIPVIITGELEIVQRILRSNQQMENLFSRLHLPDEQGDEEAHQAPMTSGE